MLQNLQPQSPRWIQCSPHMEGRVTLRGTNVPFRPAGNLDAAVKPSAFFAGEQLFISNLEDGCREVVLFNSQGQIIRRLMPGDDSKSNGVKFDCSGLARGLYIILIRQGANPVTIKVVK